MQTRGTTLNWKRALGTFLLAYVAITILGTAFSLGIAAVQHIPDTAKPMQNAAYLLTERFLPGMNLLVWASAAWLYFRRSPQESIMRHQSLALGAFWLAVALPLDLIAFVLIKTPLSLSPYDFYVGQFPWIYLIYLAVFVSPLCYVTWHRISVKTVTVAHGTKET